MKLINAVSAMAWAYRVDCLLHDEANAVRRNPELHRQYRDGYADCLEEFRTIWEGDQMNEYVVDDADAMINDTKRIYGA